MFLGWFFGDPHIQTVDGLQYVFNGYGEYFLLKPENMQEEFCLQARTMPVWDVDGNDQNATVFVALAARDNDTTAIHVELTPWDRNSEYTH